MYEDQTDLTKYASGFGKEANENLEMIRSIIHDVENEIGWEVSLDEGYQRSTHDTKELNRLREADVFHPLLKFPEGPARNAAKKRLVIAEVYKRLTE